MFAPLNSLILIYHLFSIVNCDDSGNMKLCNYSEEHIYINENNTDKFNNCNSVEGQIFITNETFSNMSPEKLSILKTVKVFKGVLNINAYHPKFTDLDFLNNLEEIDSKTGQSNEHSVIIEKTSLQSIDLPAIKSIKGIISISENKDLCYSEQWLKKRVVDIKYKDKAKISHNKNETECPCHEQCNDEGCWGPRDEHCYKCKNEKISTPRATSGSICITDCFTDTKVCMDQCLFCEGACAKLLSTERNFNNTQCAKCCKGVVILNSTNIATFRNCKTIHGDVYISNISFIDMHPRNLEILNQVTDITGYLNIEAWHIDFKNLSFLRNLKNIGRNLSKPFTTMNIEQSSLTSLKLSSLIKIFGKYGVSITNNKDLCYAENIEWTGLTNMSMVIKKNRSKNQCIIDGFVCDESCSKEGCWGAGPDQCLMCKEHKLGAICMLNCDTISCEYFCVFGCYGTCPHYCNCSGKVMHTCSDCHNLQKSHYCHQECIVDRYSRNGQCVSCHEECKSGCIGAGPDECSACKHFKDGQNCVALCPKDQYPRNGECYPCHDLCISGCTDSGIKDCYKQQNDENVKITCKVLEYLHKGECKSCNSQCKDGCSGPKASDCYSCKYIKDELNCVTSCPKNKYVSNGDCKMCNEQCKDGCNGPKASDCFSCKYNKDELNCVTSCPKNKYISNGECKICNEQCKDGCNGPNADQCDFCEFLNEKKCVSHCPEHKYPFNGNCQSCNEQCSGCSGPGNHQCESCRNVKDGEICKSSCPIDKYNVNGECIYCNGYKNTITGDCLKCNEACIDGCTGPEPKYGDGGCTFCNKVKKIDNTIICQHLNETCPDGYIERIITSNQIDLTAFIGKTMCVRQKKLDIFIIVGIIITVLVVIIFLVIGIWCLYRNRIIFNSRQNEQIEMDTFVSLNKFDTANSKCSLSRLVLIKVSEINIIKMLGKGAFGTVHEAVWNRDDNSYSIPVAIKILHQNSTMMSTKFFDEAVIMAAMDHPNILHLIAICMTKEIMLITTLMPLGCILNYVRTNKYDISPKDILIWSAQIAKGMAYLEEKQLVHRDLAARNVLLESVSCIKISDFGLSKFINSNDISAEMKLPTKWLAIECLEEGLFTHKSDVWAFGVTIWELLTFGERPFEKVQYCRLLQQLKLGLRLVQPTTCNADVYAILLRCWLQRPELRPDFLELEITFKKMSHDASKYLASYASTHFKQLNDPPQIPQNIALVRNSSYKRPNLISNPSIHYYYGINATVRNDAQVLQESKNQTLPRLRSIDSTTSDHDYLIPSAQITRKYCDYDAITK